MSTTLCSGVNRNVTEFLSECATYFL
jgi:hypothetical protein